MTGSTLLLRQIHPGFVQEGFASSQAFRPTPKDDGKLSVYDGDQITAEASFKHFTETLKMQSAGTTGLTVDECIEENLKAVPDPLPDFAEHAVIDFLGFSKGQCQKVSKKLQAKALARGWLYLAKATT